MTLQTNGRQKTQPRLRTSGRKALIWWVSAALCFILSVLGFGTDGPWYVFPGSIALAGAAGVFVGRAIRARRATKS